MKKRNAESRLVFEWSPIVELLEGARRLVRLFHQVVGLGEQENGLDRCWPYVAYSREAVARREILFSLEIGDPTADQELGGRAGVEWLTVALLQIEEVTERARRR